MTLRWQREAERRLAGTRGFDAPRRLKSAFTSPPLSSETGEQLVLFLRARFIRVPLLDKSFKTPVISVVFFLTTSADRHDGGTFVMPFTKQTFLCSFVFSYSHLKIFDESAFFRSTRRLF